MFTKHTFLNNVLLAASLVVFNCAFVHALETPLVGKVVAWGEDVEGSTTVPEGLDDVTAVAAGWGHSVALKADGTVVTWGNWAYEVPDEVSGITAIAAGSGRYTLAFSGGKLDAEIEITNFNISGNKVVKIPAKDKSFSLTLTSKTGLMKGAFTPEWTAPLNPAKKLPSFQGVLLQKGGNAGGWGFFLSNAAGDFVPESGAVTLGTP